MEIRRVEDRTADACYETLKQLLSAGNKVLLVSKLATRFVDGIIAAVDASGAPTANLEIRVSIGGLDESLRRFWEPGAPSIEERLRAMIVLDGEGFTVSASAEPLLQPGWCMELVDVLERSGASTIWIGKCNDVRKRTAWRRAELVERKDKACGIDANGSIVLDIDRFDQMLRRLEEQQTPTAMMDVYRRLKDNPAVRWKDSYQEALNLDGPGPLAKVKNTD